jgi:hypothetical protein
MVTLHFTDKGKPDTLELNLIGFDELVGEFMQWSYKGTLARFKFEESHRTSPCLVIAIYEETEEGEKAYYIDDVAALEAIDFGERYIEIVGASERKK